MFSHAPRERVSWNIAEKIHSKNNVGHAPRERVSWNRHKMNSFQYQTVTLHVSVWVEMWKNWKTIRF